jgi:hypothetical protein
MFSEIFMPALFGYIVRTIAGSLGKDDNLELKMVLIPFFVVLYVPQISALVARFLIQSLVEDKQTKMRETLRLMSLS